MVSWSDWNDGVPPDAAAASTGTKPGSWDDWSKGGGSSSPIPSAIRCPITLDAAAAHVKLPEAITPGTVFTAFVGLDGSTKARLPQALNYEVVDETTVRVNLSGSGETVSGPEYEPGPWPGSKPKPKPPEPGRPFAVLVVFPPPGQGQ